MKQKLKFIHNIKEKTRQEIMTYFKPEIFIEYCKKCQYYSKIWTCPPYDFDIEELFKDFQYFYIIGSKLSLDNLEGDLKLVALQGNANHAFNEIYEASRLSADESLIRLEEQENSLQILLPGRCLTCSKCTREKQQPCIQKSKAHFSLESLGFDVASISEDVLEDKILWSTEHLPDYLTLVSAVLSPVRLDIREIYNVIE